MNTKHMAVLGLVVLMAASCNPFARSTTYGILKTVNGGADWQFSNTIQNDKNNSLNKAEVSKLAFDPANREVLYAGTFSDGLYKSEDSGATWVNKLSKIIVYDFVVTQQDSKVLYVAGTFGDHGRLLYSKDAGATWQDVYNEESANNPVTAVAVNPEAPSQIIIGLKSGGIVKSSDSGISWRLLSTFQDEITQLSWQNGAVYVMLKNKGLFKSSTLGETFVSLTEGLVPQNYTQRFFSSEAAPSFSRFYVDPTAPSLIYVTSTQKIYKTIDEGKQWSQVSLPGDQVTARVRPINVSKSTSNIVYTAAGTTIFKSTNAGGTWQTQGIATGGIINYILIDPQLPQIAYAGVDVP